MAAAGEASRLRRAVEVIQDLERRLAEREDAAREPIAVIGMACRFPGGESPDELWRLLEDGVDPITDPPPGGGRPFGAVESLERFDAGFFRISAREARTMDPRQRITLETSWEALERAGIVPATLEGQPVGVYVGASGFVSPLGSGGGMYEFTGALPGVIAGRVSYALGLQGPSLSVDTACSSSLVALHLACKALRAGECSVALAGGVGRVEPVLRELDSTEALTHLAASGRCRTFDAAADGIVLSEGCGMVVMKRLADAERDGDAILAVIRGSALGHDGRAQGLTVPNLVAQEDVVRRALADAGLGPDEIDYVECHGTGTALGDPIEVQALGAVFGRGRARPLLIGSIKSNIGHTDAAAGIAGVVKVILALQRGRIPRNLHFAAPNPHIPWHALAVEVVSAPTAWPRGAAPRAAGVSSFGISGTNAHLVLEEAPGSDQPDRVGPRVAADGRPTLVVLSGRTPRALDDAAARLAAHVARHPDASPHDLAFSAATARAHHEHRLALPVGGRDELAAALDQVARGELPRGASRGQVRAGGAKVVFVFPGQGWHWAGMGRHLLDDEPVFRRAMEACDEAIAREVGWSVIDEVGRPVESSRLDQIEVVQPALFALGVSLAALWRSWGIEPAAVVGHSQGELTAAHVAGALSLEDAAAVVCRRARLLRRICGAGEMVMVQLPLAEASAAIAAHPDALGVGVTSSRGSTVLSGERAAMAEVVAALEARGVFCKRVRMDYASHSPQVEPLLDELVAAISSVTPGAPVVPMRSTVTGGWVGPGELGGAYWAANLRRRVRFAEVIEALLAEGHGLFVEVSGHPVLVPALEELVGDAGADGAVVGSLSRSQGERAALLASLGRLHVAGGRVDWTAALAGGRRVELPTYPWQRARYPVEPPRGQPGREESLEAAIRKLAAEGGLSDEERAALPGLLRALESRRADAEVADWLYGLEWRPRAAPPRRGPAAERWIVVEDEAGAASALAAALERAGSSAVLVAPERLRAELAAAPPAVEPPGVIAAPSTGEEALALLGQVAVLGARAPRCWLVTRGAASTGIDDPARRPDQAVVWGLGRTFALEHPQVRGGLVDLPDGELDGEIADRAVAWMAGADEDQIAIRAGGALVPRLVSLAPGARGGAAWTTAGAALVTGGLGGVGRHLAAWLARRGVRRLLLVGRRGVDAPGAAEAVAELAGQGVEVKVARADVADREAVAAAVAGLGEPVTAVFHLAGVGDETPLAELDPARLAQVLAAKRDGAEVLAELAASWPLDAFVCFSSVTSVWGGGGQAAYAAANAYLDAWAAAARARGLPATSVSWGQWAVDGMGADQRSQAFLRRRGVRSMDPDLALRALERVLASGRPHAVVADLEWTAFREAFEAWRPRPLLSELGRGVNDRAAEAPPDEPGRAEALRALSPERRRAALLDVVRIEVGRVLSTAPESLADDAALRELGLDSLMAVELQKALGARIGARLPATLAFDHPSPAALADHLASRIVADGAIAGDEPWEAETGRTGPRHEARLASLSLGQERMWFLDRLAGPSAPYNELFGLRLTGALDVERLRACLAVLVRRHESLRMTFPEVAVFPDHIEAPRALIAPDGPVPLEVVDLRDAGAGEAELGRLAAELRSRPFDLARGPLWRALVATLGERDHLLLFAKHHIITDRSSWRIFAEELSLLHESGADPAVLPEARFDYADFVRHQRRRSGQPAHREDVAWWKEHLAGLQRLELPCSRSGRHPSHAGDAVSLTIAPALREAIRDFTRREGCTLFEVLLAAWACVLHRYSGQASFAIGTIVASRGRSELDRMIGLFANTLVLRCDLDEGITFAALVRRMGQELRDCLAHQEVDFGEVVQAHGRGRGPDLSPLVQATLNLLPPPSALPAGWAWDDRIAMSATGSAKLDLGLELMDDADGLRGRLEYATDLFDRDMVEQLARHLQVLLAAGVESGEAAVATLPVMTDGERRRLLVEWNDTAADLPARCAHELFAEQARRAPDQVALVFDSRELRYGELDARANQLARHLLAAGEASGVKVGPGVVVGMCLERSFDLWVALLAILKTGAAYLPLDPSYPAERLALLLADARAPLLVSHSAVVGRAGDHAARVVLVDVEREAIGRRDRSPPPSPASLDDIAYLIYTSGSTGRPKGVEIGHRALANLVAHMARELDVRPDDQLLAITSLSFDLSVPDIYLPLCRGATCRLLSREQAIDAYALARELERATLMQATPSTWQMLIESGWRGSPRLRAVVGGEAVSWPLALALAGRTARVWNCYGPTETTVWSAMWPIDPARGAVSLGRGIANTRLHVLDARMELVPVGVPGELFIGGAGLARGYRDRPELTRERFVADPFAPGERLYRTGDRVQWSRDGTLEFLDRVDLQVKIRGYRIELGEVEAALGSHPAVSRCAVVAQRSGLDARLVGFYVARDGAAVTADELRHHLRTTLPDQMVPSLLVPLAELPLNPNGKIDRPALSLMEAAGAPEVRLQPRDEMEHLLAEVWREVLGLSAVDVGRTFFDHGGTSLQLVRVQRRLEDAGRKVTVAELFAYPTIEELADHLRDGRRSAPAADADPEDDRLPDLEELSLAELQRAVKDGLQDLLDEDS